MARVSKVDACMFCGNTPCTCNSTKKQTSAKRAAKKSLVPITNAAVAASPAELAGHRASSEKADLRLAMRTAAANAAPMISEAVQERYEIDEILEDPEMVLAIQAVGTLMHNTERLRFARVLAADVSPQDRAKAWKKRIADEP